MLSIGTVSCSAAPEAVIGKREVRAESTSIRCLSDEKPIFACEFEDGAASVCLGKSKVRSRLEMPLGDVLKGSSDAGWSNVRTFVNRSQGGLNQDRIRITEGSRHYVFYWGETGSLSENPGSLFAGAVVLEGDTRAREIAKYECKPGSVDASASIEGLGEQAPGGWIGDEDADGPFAGIF